MRRRPSWIVITVLALVWGLLNGVLSLATFLGGLLVGTAIVVLLQPFFSWHPSARRLARKTPAFLRYAARFLYELVKANLQVAYLALHPRMPIRPGIIAYRTRHRSPLGITLLANSITLTPGTLTMDVSPDGQILYIHTLDVSHPETVRAAIGRGLEDYTLEVAE
jgi:multicomponent Na+:H+ antiporter subunit E